MKLQHYARLGPRLAQALGCLIPGVFGLVMAYACWMGVFFNNAAMLPRIPVFVFMAALAFFCLGTSATAILLPPRFSLEGDTLRLGPHWWFPGSLFPEQAIRPEEITGWAQRPPLTISFIRNPILRHLEGIFESYISGDELCIDVRLDKAGGVVSYSIPLGAFTRAAQNDILHFLRTRCSTPAAEHQQALPPAAPGLAGDEDREYRYEMLGFFANIGVALLCSGAFAWSLSAMSEVDILRTPKIVPSFLAGVLLGGGGLGIWFGLMSIHSLLRPGRILVTQEGLRMPRTMWGLTEQVIRFDEITAVRLDHDPNTGVYLHLQRPTGGDCWIFRRMLTQEDWEAIGRTLDARVGKSGS